MGTLDKAFHEAVREAVRFEKITTKLIARRLADQGIELSQEQLDTIEIRLGSINIDDDVSTIQIDDLVPDACDREKLFIDLGTSEELDEIFETITRQTTSAIPEIITTTAQSVLEHLKRDAPRMLEEHRRQQVGFEGRLFQHWGKALDLLEMLTVIALEAADEFNQEHRPTAINNRDLVFEVLTRLHARACQVAQEILTLLRSGFADGAHARWRTLHEITVVAWFIQEQGNDVAERYLLHQHIEAYKAALQHQKYHDRLGERPLSARQMNRLKNAHDQLVNRFGATYKNSYGWASAALGKKDPNFNDIEQAVALDHWRPYYKLASHNVHANPKGALFRLGLYQKNSSLLLAGASNAGLADPGHGAVISLSQITITVLTLKVNLDRMVICQLITTLVDESAKEFITAHKELSQPRRVTGRRRTRRWKRRV